jgi:hypothetical protein
MAPFAEIQHHLAHVFHIPRSEVRIPPPKTLTKIPHCPERHLHHLGGDGLAGVCWGLGLHALYYEQTLSGSSRSVRRAGALCLQSMQLWDSSREVKVKTQGGAFFSGVPSSGMPFASGWWAVRA